MSYKIKITQKEKEIFEITKTLRVLEMYNWMDKKLKIKDFEDKVKEKK